MKLNKPSFNIILPLISLVAILSSFQVEAQLSNGVYMAEQKGQRHELKIKDNYIVHSIYDQSPAKFIKTKGGYFTHENDELTVKLEFDSDFDSNKSKEWSVPVLITDDQLTMNTDPALTFTKTKNLEQDLDGQWLFATRGPDDGQERRGDDNPRKTLKFLIDGRFQWIAYNTETFKFHGTGGGSFTSSDGIYTEQIEYFSKDNSRVGATLQFKYEIKGNDWHHTGKNSKGEPMYEIWSTRGV